MIFSVNPCVPDCRRAESYSLTRWQLQDSGSGTLDSHESARIDDHVLSILGPGIWAAKNINEPAWACNAHKISNGR